MKIDNSVIQIISHFGDIINRETKDKIEVLNVNVDRDHIAVMTGTFIAYYNNKSKHDNNRFTVPNAKNLMLSKEKLINSVFELKYIEEMGQGVISSSIGISQNIINFMPNQLSKEQIEELVNADELASFYVDSREHLFSPFKTEMATMKKEGDRLMLKITNTFDYKNYYENDGELSRDTHTLKAIDDDSGFLDGKDIRELVDIEILDAIGQEELKELENKILKVKETLDTSLLDDYKGVKDSLKKIESSIKRYQVAKEKDVYNEPSLNLDDGKNGEIYEAEKILDASLKEFRIKTENRIHKDSKKRQTKLNKEIEDHNAVLKEQEVLMNRVPLVELSMQSEYSSSKTYVYDTQSVLEKSSDFTLFLDQNLLKYIVFNEKYKIRVKKDGFVVIEYAGKSDELCGLYYIMPTWSEN